MTRAGFIFGPAAQFKTGPGLLRCYCLFRIASVISLFSTRARVNKMQDRGADRKGKQALRKVAMVTIVPVEIPLCCYRRCSNVFFYQCIGS